MKSGAAAALAGASDTIVAEATAHGRGALAVIRLSGPRAHEIARRIIDNWPPEPRVATLANLSDADGSRLDEAVVTRYDAPASFTGDDSVELSAHGGATVPATIVAALIAAGARQALPGEFTRRAVLNGKLDLLQAGLMPQPCQRAPLSRRNAERRRPPVEMPPQRAARFGQFPCKLFHSAGI